MIDDSSRLLSNRRTMLHGSCDDSSRFARNRRRFCQRRFVSYHFESSDDSGSTRGRFVKDSWGSSTVVFPTNRPKPFAIVGRFQTTFCAAEARLGEVSHALRARRHKSPEPCIVTKSTTDRRFVSTLITIVVALSISQSDESPQAFCHRRTIPDKIPEARPDPESRPTIRRKPSQIV